MANPAGGYASAPPGMQQQPQVVVVQQRGNCPACQVGYMTESFSICGIVLAVLFFPLGLICCLLMKERKCGNCGYSG